MSAQQTRGSAKRSRALFITGASGFIGRAVRDGLAIGDYDTVTCLTRRPDFLAAQISARAGWCCVGGDLDDPPSYSAAVADADTVIHLAAATGKASTTEMERVNVHATRKLLEECERQGVPRVLYVSSIAARYPDLDGYPYGRTKLEAEGLVRGTRLDFTILRPTIVLGEHSPIWLKLRKLASLPIVPLFGDGTARVQPVAVADAARGIIAILDHGRFLGETIELGGPEVVTFSDFVVRIRHACGRGSARLVRLPVQPVQALLSAAGRVLGGLMPVGAGQLAPFVNDGTAGPNDLYDQLRPSMIPLDALLQRLARAA